MQWCLTISLQVSEILIIKVPVSKRSPWQLYNMYGRVHIPPYHRCTKFENFLRVPIICRDIPNFVNFILVYVRL